MKSKTIKNMLILLMAAIAVLAAIPRVALGALPVVKTVPWVPANPLIPHDTWSGKMVTLKGTSDSEGENYEWTWDFGDGSPTVSGTVIKKYVIEAQHAYTGSTGQVFTARLTVRNTVTNETGSQVYYVKMNDQSLNVEVNVAIDEGLWYLQKDMYRYSSGGGDFGNWAQAGQAGGYATYGAYAMSAANLNAFEVQGHLETGNPANPYVETVQRAMRSVLNMITAGPLSAYTGSNFEYNADTGFYDKSHDGNGNSLIVWVNQNLPWYQGGMFMDAIVASGTPDAIAQTGGSGIPGMTYKDIVQDMLDAYAGAQYDYYPAGGGWRYGYNEWPDNSVCQWAAIGIIAAERQWGCVVPSWLKPWNIVWLNHSHNPGGWFGYTDNSYVPWGPFATSPSGMVQCAMDGIGRGNSMWGTVESYLRDTFDNVPVISTNNVKGYYYGLFSFVKAMLFHDADGDGIAEPLQFLQTTSSSGKPDIDWYAAELSKGDTSNGVARTLVNDQSTSGYWFGHNYEWEQQYLETAFAIMMLNRTVIESGSPVAVIQATPNPGVVGQIINLSGSSSYHQDASKSIISWEWDLDNDGQFDDATGPTAQTGPFPALGDYVASLKVTDNGSPSKSATTYLTIRITIPPVAPTANAGGPYVLCPQAQPWFLDGTGSINPDEGMSEPGQPGDTIIKYEWDLDGTNNFNNATGAIPDVTAYFIEQGPGSYLIQLRVTDNTAVSFPSSGYPDLTSTDSAEVIVKAMGDTVCECVGDLGVQSTFITVELVWTSAGVSSYNVYRSTIPGGPYMLIGNTTSSAYTDTTAIAGNTYYYVVREVALNGNELCQSNEVSANIEGCTDADKDGYSVEGGDCGDVDCDDSNLAVNPGAEELCDGIDNNCNGAIDEGCLINVSVDIMPGLCPNPVGLVRSFGVATIALVGKADFDVTQIDPASIRISREGVDATIAPMRWNYSDVATPFYGELCKCNRLREDGYIDLSMKFRRGDLFNTLNLQEYAGLSIPLKITGNLKDEFGGTPIEGSDCVRVLKSGL